MCVEKRFLNVTGNYCYDSWPKGKNGDVSISSKSVIKMKRQTSLAFGFYKLADVPLAFSSLQSFELLFMY